MFRAESAESAEEMGSRGDAEPRRNMIGGFAALSPSLRSLRALRESLLFFPSASPRLRVNLLFHPAFAHKLCSPAKLR